MRHDAPARPSSTALALLFLAFATAAAAGPLERAWPLAPTGRFDLHADAADVRIEQGAAAEARLVVRLREGADPASVRFEDEKASPDRVSLAVRSTPVDDPNAGFLSRMLGGTTRQSAIQEIVLTLPTGAACGVKTGTGDVHAATLDAAELTTGAGDVEIGEARGPLRIQTGTGDVKVALASAALDLRTGAGDVEVGDAKQELAVRTGTGDVRIVNAAGAVEAHTGAGDLSVKAASGLSASTGTGDVNATAARGAVALKTGAGDVRLHLDALDADVQVSTGTGDVDVTVKAGAARAELSSGIGSVRFTGGGRTLSDDGPRARVTAEAPGAPLIEVTTGAGDVTTRLAS